jgi:hypothetical protein
MISTCVVGGVREGVKVALERPPQNGLRGRGVGPRKRHHQLGGLADIANIGEPEDRR